MKALFILEYDDIPEGEIRDVARQILDNVAVVSEEGIRPARAHVATEEPAYKILSVLQADS